ncbi:sigma-54-dependent transcriptional regulator [Peredibacter starrii]|uniref:Sigma-54 dependent transcriptional regulator n=1 Tax=Peredibacter starrii TaxID=28202 RepID=A0AAX4HQ02_9BACT|nr:sigma-54 dependent transcriptional regulator [Peredibacter starrii]WPU65321.1 sigma-54 dependent transcriptional regulator [Peredibacter starrii]
MHKVLVVDDDKVLQQNVKQALEYHHFVVDVADNGKEAVNKVYGQKYDLVVMDVNMPEMDGIQALTEIKKHDPSVIVLILTAYSNVTDAVKAVKEGAYNYLEKPITSENLVALIKRALKARSMVETVGFSSPTLSIGETSGSKDKFVGESNAMKKVFDVISKLAKVNTPVLIRGESGTGKELVAKAIHYNSPRKDEKFVTINCGAISENLIESELFGHEKGAFTGADQRKIGKFQFAEGGTIFLDEIGDISAAMQVKLLRVLQEKTFMPVGSNREIKVDVRIIAASHKPFEEMIKDGSFREDLFYRLNVLPVYLPPLRDRKTDIPHLVNHYISYFNNVHNLKVKGAEPEAMEVLSNYSWPGNIRELRNIIEHCFIMESSDMIHANSLPSIVFKDQKKAETKDQVAEDSVIDLEDIQNSVLDHATVPKSGNDVHFSFGAKLGEGGKLDFAVAKDLFEREFIVQALKINKGRINQTALNANIPKKTLLRKIEKYEINPKDYY